MRDGERERERERERKRERERERDREKEEERTRKQENNHLIQNEIGVCRENLNSFRLILVPIIHI